MSSHRWLYSSDHASCQRSRPPRTPVNIPPLPFLNLDPCPQPFGPSNLSLKVWIYLGVKWHEAIWVQQQLPAYPGGVGSGTPGIAAVRNASGLLLSAAQPYSLHPGLGLKMPPLFLPLFMVYGLLFVVYCLLFIAVCCPNPACTKDWG